MEVVKKQRGRTGKLVMKEKDEEVGEVSFMINDDSNYVIEHTSVKETMSGKGVAIKLIEAMVELARNEQKKIIPLCEYAKKIFERKADNYSDVWDKRK